MVTLTHREIGPEIRLARSIERLTRPYALEHTQRMPGGGRRMFTISHPPLIYRLRTASLSSGGANAGSPELGRSVIDGDAIEKLGQIRSDIVTVWDWLGFANVPAPRLSDLEPALDAWHDAFEWHRRADALTAEQIEDAAHIWTGWEHTIEAKFDAPRRMINITEPCPECGTLWHVTGTGELEQRVYAVVLAFTGSAATISAACRHCGRTWVGPAMVRELDRKQRAAKRTDTDSRHAVH